LNSIYFKNIYQNCVTEILKEIYLDKIYEPFLINRFNLTIVDIGANVGLTSFYFKDFAKIVYAIEPAKEHLKCLQTMVTQNNIQNIKILPFAVSNKQGKTKLYHSPNPTAHSLMDISNNNDFEEVQTITLDWLIKQDNLDHIDFLKADMEGEESTVFTDPEFAKIAPKISSIVGEWHDWGFTSKSFFKETMERLGYHFSWNRESEAAIFTCVRI